VPPVLVSKWRSQLTLIWQEHNDRIFRRKLSPTFVILDKIKCEARLWVLAGAKWLGDLMPGE
jgi:hypothetical protein